MSALPKSDLIVNVGAVVTGDDDFSVIFDGHVKIKGDRIIAVAEGKGSVTELTEAGRLIEAPEMVAMPGLIDLHFHTALARCYVDRLSLREGIHRAWYPLQRAMTADAVYVAALASYVEALRSGVTTVNDMYHQLESRVSAAREVGIRAVLSAETSLPEHGLDSLEENAAALVHGRAASDDRVQVWLGIEAVTVASQEMLSQACSLAQELGCGVHIHLSETRSEVMRSRRRYGRSPIEVAFDSGLLNEGTVVGHCVYPTASDIALLRESGASIAHCPASNSKLGIGVSPVPRLIAEGINIGLGHDSIDCSGRRDLFEVMRYAGLLHRAHGRDPSLFTARQLLTMATRNGARALHLEAGVLEQGAKADVVLVDLADLSMRPRLSRSPEHLLSLLAFAAGGHLVDTVIVDGRVVVEHRRILTIDDSELAASYDSALEAMLERAGLPREGFH